MRSRLEARYAVFFDALKTPWEYEKEGFDLGTDGRYLPDFWLPELGCWVEIKPEYPTEREILKAERLGEEGHAVVIAYGLPLDRGLLVWCMDDTGSTAGTNWWGEGLFFHTNRPQWAWSEDGLCICSDESHHSREFCGPDGSPFKMRLRQDCTRKALPLRRAVEAARSARFERYPRNMRRALEDGGAL